MSEIFELIVFMFPHIVLMLRHLEQYIHNDLIVMMRQEKTNAHIAMWEM